MVDRVDRPALVLHLGQRRPDRLDVGPVLGVRGALLDPAFEQRRSPASVSGLPSLAGGIRQGGVGGHDAGEQLALVRLAGDDRLAGAALEVLHRAVAGVEAQAGLAGLVVGAVAVQTLARQDGPDVALVIHRLAGRPSGGGRQRQREDKK